ncbi:ubiquinone biosynthesis protein COQ9 [Sphingobium wenxiniae]|uniref:RpsU-divergently transcribed protein n=2 Tax=Sphingobium TaxID=165695 RepID=T0HI88_9SPHN|nr:MULTISPECIES: COQ9 family protein [Sphingobium]EQA99089.1 rpsU-divergently transcribed protein [Sphingobium baderi LL03]KMS61454.1 rpsU-divergently transcribed protein [Sphingobium baderi LL03]MBB6191732.1 ubiquinone biosynthesis protein COQ9 [Sphingobium wenxiniae]TWH96766.1 ubiquinone biosynthesis protein COQ9 [Sphingobium wenxiniae]
MTTQDMTLDEVRCALAPLLPRHAAFDGWKPEAVAMAAAEKGVDADIAGLAFADGPMDMIDAWFASIDARMMEALPSSSLAAMSIRARITALVETRLALLAPDREALRRAVAIMAMPRNSPRAAKLGWRAADMMWRAAGDEAADLSHYSKRMTLAGVYAATLLVFLDDESDGHAESRAFLARRIEDVMRFERTKARFKGVGGGERLSLSRFIGRLRYPAI